MGNYLGMVGTYLEVAGWLSNLIVFFLYDAVFEASPMQGSIGKKICNIIVVDYHGRRLTFAKALGRNFGKILSGMICFVGYLNVLWDDKSQAWHDQLAKAGTRCSRIGQLTTAAKIPSAIDIHHTGS